jgi:hypothetical protein
MTSKDDGENMFPRKTQAELDECAYGCSGRQKEQQRLLTENEISRLSDRARHAVDTTLGRALICSYCGGVHLREPHANIPLGMLDGRAGQGWHSRNYP